MGWGHSVGGLVAAGLLALPAAAQSRDAAPLSTPAPRYPQHAYYAGTEGYCEVRFDLTAEGVPQNLVTLCTDRVFCVAARVAVSEVRFSPALDEGMPRARDNIVYPLFFIRSNASQVPREPLLDCYRPAPAP